MAYICEKPAGFCEACEHYRFDEDYGAYACFAAVDIASAKGRDSEK